MILTHYLIIIWKTKSSPKKALKDDASFIIGWVDTFPKNMVLLWVRKQNMILQEKYDIALDRKVLRKEEFSFGGKAVV